jgi:glucokinase
MPATDTCRPEDALLVADIGGTNARLGVARRDARRKTIAVSAIDTLRCADYPDIGALIADYLARLDAGPPSAGCFAVAGPLLDNVGTLTNIGWRVDGAQLAQRLGLGRVRLVNDFGALASSVPYLTAADLFEVRGAAPVHGPISVAGAGTGFGVALLVPNERAGWDLVATEGGHVSFAPTTRREQQVWEFLRGYEEHVCVEHVLSGTGIVNIYGALAGRRTDMTPDEISQRALAGDDPRSREAIDIFLDVYGSVAGNVALLQGARGGVFLGGGILPKLLPLLDRTRFCARFDAKGIMAKYVAALPIRLITAEYPALTGAAAWYWGENR